MQIRLILCKRHPTQVKFTSSLATRNLLTADGFETLYNFDDGQKNRRRWGVRERQGIKWKEMEKFLHDWNLSWKNMNLLPSKTCYFVLYNMLWSSSSFSSPSLFWRLSHLSQLHFLSSHSISLLTCLPSIKHGNLEWMFNLNSSSFNFLSLDTLINDLRYIIIYSSLPLHIPHLINI